MALRGDRAMARILIMEDDQDFATVLSGALEETGHSVVVSADGAAAMEELRATRYDLLITDIYVRQDGRATADGGILFNYEQCFECGTCYLVCNEAGAITWTYPDGGHGVAFRRS